MSMHMDSGECEECGCDLEPGHSFGKCGDCEITDPLKMANREFLNHMMTFSRSGPMMQLFIMESLRKMAEATVKEDPTVLAEQGGIWNIINPHAWVAAARELDQMFQDRQR